MCIRDSSYSYYAFHSLNLNLIEERNALSEVESAPYKKVQMCIRDSNDGVCLHKGVKK